MSEVLNKFTDFVRDLGYTPSEGFQFTQKFKWRSIHISGDKRSKKLGSYWIIEDELGGFGQFIHWREGVHYTFSSKNEKPITDEQRKEWQRARKEAEEKEEQRQNLKRKALNRRIGKFLKHLPPAPPTHNYIIKKQINPHNAYYYAKRRCLVLPVMDGDTYTSLQLIYENGAKFFLKGGKVGGSYLEIKGFEDETVILCEGYSTGCSIYDATGYTTICAWSAHNLEKVADKIVKDYPNSKIIIAADNDAFTFANGKKPEDINKDDIKGNDPRWNQWREQGLLYNTGIDIASKIAEKYSLGFVFPEFEKIENKSTDFNDLCLISGANSVKQRIADYRVLVPQVSSESDNSVPQSMNVAPTGHPISNQAELSEDIKKDLWAQKVPLLKFKREPVFSSNGQMIKEGKIEPKAMTNFIMYLQYHPTFQDCFVFDYFKYIQLLMKPLKGYEEKNFKPRTITDSDLTKIVTILEGYGLTPSNADIQKALAVVCEENQANPLKDHLENLEWDGVPRLDTWLIDYCGATDLDYIRRVGACWLIAGVKRIRKPGTPFHHMLVLEGGQGVYKSTMLRELSKFVDDNELGDYFTDSLNIEDIGKNSLVETLQGKVIVEFGEIRLNAKDHNKVKQWMTQDNDEIVRKYENRPRKFPRTYILAATTNDSNYLNDPTGSRRFWPVRVGKVNIEEFRKIKKQLWAEAVHREMNGELHYILPEEPVYNQIIQAQKDRHIIDDWYNTIEAYSEKKYKVSVKDVAKEALGISIDKIDYRVSKRINEVFQGMGWEKKPMRVDGKLQRVWVNPAYEENQSDLIDEVEIAF